MAEGRTLEIFNQIQSLVSDQLQVVSYKWLSRNFSVSSNHAKSLLHDFVTEHKNELEVVYTLSGWLKNSPQSYHIRLVSGHNLAEVKKEFKANCSVQVYSVQACIPKDLAVLWSVEFLQAEELFNQPSTTENCLRDNRFGSVSNSYVQRTIDGKSVAAVSQLNIGISVKPKASSILKDSSMKRSQGSVAQPSVKQGMQSPLVDSSGATSEKTAPVSDQSTKLHLAKESATALHINKKKVQNGKTLSGNGGSLASLWGCASEKAKPSSPALGTTLDAPNAAFSAEAQISAYEATDALSSDDDGPSLNHKRELNGANNRKRRVIDFSDDDEDENMVSHASPGPPEGNIFLDSLHDAGKLITKKNPSVEQVKEEKSEVKQNNLKERDSGVSTENELRGGNKKNIAGISLQKRPQSDSPKEHADPYGHNNGTDKKTSIALSPKRRKVLKTRTDEKGREVTEVVWEDDADHSNTEKNMQNNGVENRPTVENKAPAAGTNTSTNPASKTGTKKTAKGGSKDAKQGNILSFFKKL